MSKYENHNLDGSELPFIYRENKVYPKKTRFSSSNWHENIEILIIDEGFGAVSVNGDVISVCPGDAVIFNNNCLHSIAAENSELRYRYLIIDRSFCLSNGFDTNKIRFRVKIRDERIMELLNRLCELYQKRDEMSFSTLAIRTTVLELAFVLCSAYTEVGKNGRTNEDSTAEYIKKAIDYISASYKKDFSLDDVAEFVGVSKYYLSRGFHKYTGYPFVSYVNYTRCKMAKKLLADTRISIYEVANRCGFSNKSYFAKSFKRYIGILPGEYRKELTKGY